MMMGFAPLIAQALALGAAGVVGDLAARKVWDHFTQDKDQQAEFPIVIMSLVQLCLNRLGADIDVDGIQGTETTKAVRRYQTKAGLEADGIIGPETLKAIVQDLQTVEAGERKMDTAADNKGAQT